MSFERVVLSTAGSGEEAERLSRLLVEEGLAACVNRVAGVRSVYRWQGEVCDDAEWLLVIKTTEEHVEAINERLTEEHEYDLPEVVALPVVGGSSAYLEWLRAALRTPGGD